MSIAFEPSLGRDARAGTLAELSQGTFAAAADLVNAGRGEDAARFLEVSVLEAEELHEIYGAWPDTTADWIRSRGVPSADLQRAVERLHALLGASADTSITARWPLYLAQVAEAAEICRGVAREDRKRATTAIEAARACWHDIHDDAVDLVSGMVDVAVRLVGEDALGDLWDHLMADWYDVHERRYSREFQPWSESARQLTAAIFDGFHAHLTGPDRSGAIEVIEEEDRIGFRFAPCGSGGRSLAASITDGQPRAGAPFDFAVTTEPHDFAWNRIGICSYCVHCCQLNEAMPIDRLGYPTRVIDAPTWPTTEANPTCTWWIYRDPALVPDSVYERVGRRRPATVRSHEGVRDDG